MIKPTGKKIIFSLFIFIFLNSFSFAQLTDTIEVSPENPGAFQDVTLTIRSYAFDVDTVSITWDINNKVVLSGVGEKKLLTKTGGVGLQKIVHVIAMKGSQKVFDQVISLNPQSVDLIWESKESYVPPFYEGKALPGESSLVSVVALPNFIYNGKTVDPKTISYAWYLNDEIIKDASGFNKQNLIMNLDYLSEKNIIRVAARDQNGNIAEKEIVIAPEQIDPVFYLNDPLFGIDLNRAIQDRFETNKEFTLNFVPYYLSTKNIPDDQIKSSWSLDGLPLTNIKNNSISLKPLADSYGSKVLRINIENTSRILQEIKTSLEIIFDTRK